MVRKSAPRVDAILETAIYVDDVERAARFYEQLFGFERLGDATERMCALDVSGRSVLLIFKRTASLRGVAMPGLGEGAAIPPHDGAGPAHFAFAIPPEDLAAWEDRLAALAVEIESRITWPRGGTSLYFRDPDGHSVELVTPGVWRTY